MPDEIIQGIKNAAKLLDIHRDTIHRHIKAGTFPVPVSEIKFGDDHEHNIRMWKKKHLEQWKENRERNKGKGWKIGRKRS